MKLIEKHIISRHHEYYNDLKDLCFKSKNLYNAALYAIRQYYFDVKYDPNVKYKYLNYYTLCNKMKDEKNVDFYAICSNAALATLKLVDQNFKSFFSLLKMKQKGLYTEKIQLPKYLKKDGYFPFVINTINCKRKQKLNNILQIPNTNIQIHTDKANISKQLRVIYKGNHILIEIIYDKIEKPKKEDNKRYMSIDLGVNNLCTVTSNVCKSFIIDGKRLKHINRYWNKSTSILKSKLSNGQYISNLIRSKNLKRNNQVDYYMHKVSRILINQAVSNNINTIVIGKNKQWKQEIKMNKINALNFVLIPFDKLINMIIYKAKLEGINVILQEESYTSKVSFIDNDYIPVYGQSNNLYQPSGKRTHRGLYKTSTGLKLNADINGSLNILRKYLKCNSDEIISPADVGFIVNPVRLFI